MKKGWSLVRNGFKSDSVSVQAHLRGEEAHILIVHIQHVWIAEHSILLATKINQKGSRRLCDRSGGASIKHELHGRVLTSHLAVESATPILRELNLEAYTTGSNGSQTV